MFLDVVEIRGFNLWMDKTINLWTTFQKILIILDIYALTSFNYVFNNSRHKSMKINKKRAEELVLEFTNKDRPENRQLIIVDVSESPHGWIFLYDYKEQIESKYKRFGLTGNHPIFVFETSTIKGRMYFLSPKEDLDEVIKRHQTYEKISEEQSSDQETAQHSDGQSEALKESRTQVTNQQYSRNAA